MSLNAIAVPAKTFTQNGQVDLAMYSGGSYNGYGFQNAIGQGHMGPTKLQRVTMAVRLGVESEVRWALSTLTEVLANSALLLPDQPFLGHEMIKYFTRPYQLIVEEKQALVTAEMMLELLDCLLLLRNCAQDLENQRWLSQLKLFKKSVVEVLRFLTQWFFHAVRNRHLRRLENQFYEALRFLIDLLEPLTCYWIDNANKDPLFNILLATGVLVSDKLMVVGILKCLSHLLITRPAPTAGDPDDERAPVVNCVDLIKDSQLEHFVNLLLVSDNELTFTVLEFLKQYLTLEAVHPKCSTVRESQLWRLQTLLQLKGLKLSFNTLIKQLPLLVVANLPLNAVQAKPLPHTLTKRSQFLGVPLTLPELNDVLYNLIVRFPEPLRATTWLRCCYEPYITSQSEARAPGDLGEVVAGEVTQISLWKAYENQFQEIWDSDVANPEYKPLLPAVDFIKNVTHAFPNLEAMVVNLEAGPDEPAKKKFIIKGIQPRQFAVPIDTGNYEALKPLTVSLTNLSQNHKLPIGHMDQEKFDHALNALTELILDDGSKISANEDFVTPINRYASDILTRILNDVFEANDNLMDDSLFRFYNSHWLPEVVYANPLLLELGLIDIRWLKYLV